MSDYIKFCREYIRNLSTKEVMHYADMYNECRSPGEEVARVKDMLNAEMERRIANWEVAEV